MFGIKHGRKIAITVVILLVALSDSYKLAFDNDNSVIKMESNKMVNGKLVGEPKPDQAINDLAALGFKVTNVKADSGDKDALKMLRARVPLIQKHSSMEIKPHEPIDQVFRKISQINEAKQKSSSQNQNEATNAVESKTDVKQASSYDIYITNVNENVNVNNGTNQLTRLVPESAVYN